MTGPPGWEIDFSQIPGSIAPAVQTVSRLGARETQGETFTASRTLCEPAITRKFGRIGTGVMGSPMTFVIGPIAGISASGRRTMR